MGGRERQVCIGDSACAGAGVPACVRACLRACVPCVPCVPACLRACVCREVLGSIDSILALSVSSVDSVRSIFERYVTVSATKLFAIAISCSSGNGAECTKREPLGATLRLFSIAFTRFDSIGGFGNRFDRFDLLLDSIDTRFSCH